MSRGKRSAKTAKKSTLRANMVTLGTQTAGVVFGIPHLAIYLIGREIARTEGVVVSLIHWKDRIDSVADMRAMRSSANIETMENFMDDAFEKVNHTVTDMFSRKEKITKA